MGWTFSITIACYFREHQYTLHLASEDVLTSLPNRRSIDETLNRALERARRLRGFLREADYAGRLGGDEFLLIVHGVDNRRSAGRVAERLRSALDGPAALGTETASIAIAVGVAIWPGDGDSADALLTAADRNMYADKHGHS